jgi:hypothetical protein
MALRRDVFGFVQAADGHTGVVMRAVIIELQLAAAGATASQVTKAEPAASLCQGS